MSGCLKSVMMHSGAWLCMGLKSIWCVSGGFSGGLLPVLPVSHRKHPEIVLRVRVRGRYGKFGSVGSVGSWNNGRE